MGMRCPTCGTQYGDEARFCTKDGGRLMPAEASSRATAVRHPDAPTPVPAGGSATSHANMAGQVLDRRYLIVKKVGEGGMSYVYLARDVSTEQRYAIKILSPSLAKDETAMARLRREAALGIRLAHPNVCHIVRMGETEEGLVYVVMPFVEGEILSDRNYRVGQTTLADTATFITEIADGLQVAHALGIVHRDLKPENIMICKKSDGTEFAVVMDFGLAKERKSAGELQKLTATGIILGTPEFMSPEQLRGKPLDGRTDIYSLALMTYEMLTGKLPFEGNNQQAMMIARLRNEPIPARNRRPELPERVDEVLLRAMAREASDRYATAPEFAAALRAAIG